MKRTRQESAEFYEVTGTEIALALGLYVNEGDEVEVKTVYGDKVGVVVRHRENENFELEAPVFDPILQAYGNAAVAAAIQFGITPLEFDEIPVAALPLIQLPLEPEVALSDSDKDQLEDFC